jgi:hypothetical protein
LDGNILRVFDNSRLGKNCLHLVARRQHPAAGIQNLAPLRFFRYQFLLLSDGEGIEMLALEMLEIKAPPRK